jgi:hypothetical protein
MGLFDRLLGTRPAPVKVSGQSESPKPTKDDASFFLDADSSSSLGDLNFMRRSNRIRRTFPGNADSPGGKELVVDVASMEARLETSTPGLGGVSTEVNTDVNLTDGVPKPVKKTFAQQISSAELSQRMKGSAVAGTNTPGGPDAAAARRAQEQGNTADGTGTPQGGRPGAIDPFRSMAKDFNA